MHALGHVWCWILLCSNTVSHRARGRQGFLSRPFSWAHLRHPNFVPTGVITYAIGVAWAAQDELEVIATHPAKDHSFFVDEFDNLYKSVPKIIQNICTEFNSQPRNWIQSRQGINTCCFPTGSGTTPSALQGTRGGKACGASWRTDAWWLFFASMVFHTSKLGAWKIIINL